MNHCYQHFFIYQIFYWRCYKLNQILYSISNHCKITSHNKVVRKKIIWVGYQQMRVQGYLDQKANNIDARAVPRRTISMIFSAKETRKCCDMLVEQSHPAQSLLRWRSRAQSKTNQQSVHVETIRGLRQINSWSMAARGRRGPSRGCRSMAAPCERGRAEQGERSQRGKWRQRGQAQRGGSGRRRPPGRRWAVQSERGAAAWELTSESNGPKTHMREMNESTARVRCFFFERWSLKSYIPLCGKLSATFQSNTGKNKISYLTPKPNGLQLNESLPVL
jgi:hypothetical protein